jgi:hypothetical protein
MEPTNDPNDDDARRNEAALERLLDDGLRATYLKNQWVAQHNRLQRQRLTRRMAGVAGLLVVVGLSVAVYYAYWHTNPRLAALAAAVQVDPFDPEAPTSGDERYSPRLDSSRRQYFGGRFREAAATLAGQPTDSLRQVPYYRGLALLQLGQPNAAVSDLLLAQQSPDKQTSLKAQWYLSLAYLKAADGEKATQALQRILADPTYPRMYRNKAAALLDSLRR